MSSENLQIDIFNDDEKISEVVNKLKMEGKKARYFAIIVYPSENFCRINNLATEYFLSGASSGWGTAPDDWRDTLLQLGYTFVCSPLHDKDIDKYGNIKKPHYHLIIIYGNTTTFNSVKCRVSDYLNSPPPIVLTSPVSYYNYLDHSDDESKKANKYQYDKKDIQYYNCSANQILVLLDESSKSAILMLLVDFIKSANIQSYDDFLFLCRENFPEYLDFATQNTFFFNSVLKSVTDNRKKALQEQKISYRLEVLQALKDNIIDIPTAQELLKNI